MTTMAASAIDVEGATITLESVGVGELNVDYAYQRPLRPATWRKYAKDFDLEKFGTPMISERADGTLWVIDGQHRIRAATEALDLDDAQKVPAIVYRGLTVQKEADLWSAYNVDRTAPHREDNHKALVVAGRPLACAVEKVVRAKGYEIGVGLAAGRIQAVSVCYQLQEHGVLADTLDTVGGAWGSDRGGLQGPILKAVGLIHARYGRKVNKTRLRDRLASTTPDALVARAKAARGSDPDVIGNSQGQSGKSLVDFIARIIVSSYNFRLRQGKLSTWTTRPARQYWDKNAR